MLVIVLLVSFFLLLFIGVPISFALSISSFTAVMTTGAIPVINLVQKTFRAIDSFTLLAIPFFVFAGNVMARGGVSKRLTDMAATLVGRMPGGLAHVATLSSTFFGAISGSAPATTSAIGAVMVPEMEKRSYDKAFTAAVVAASGTIGLIIPPSNTMVMYGTLANASVGKMFIGGVGPGLLMTVVIIVINYLISKKRGYAGSEHISGKQVAEAFKNGIWALLMPVIILGGIYGGICSPTEAATISIFYSLVVSLFIYRSINIRDLPKIMLEGVHSYAPILIILSAAVAFARVITLMNVASIVSEAVLSAISSKVVILLLINVLLLFVGMIMDTGPAILVFTPVLLPVVEALGVDPVHFGIIMCVNLAIGFVTPPMGANLFVASNHSKVPVFDIARKAIPFILAFLVALLLITFVPQISMFLVQ